MFHKQLQMSYVVFRRQTPFTADQEFRSMDPSPGMALYQARCELKFAKPELPACVVIARFEQGKSVVGERLVKTIDDGGYIVYIAQSIDGAWRETFFGGFERVPVYKPIYKRSESVQASSERLIVLADIRDGYCFQIGEETKEQSEACRLRDFARSEGFRVTIRNDRGVEIVPELIAA